MQSCFSNQSEIKQKSDWNNFSDSEMLNPLTAKFPEHRNLFNGIDLKSTMSKWTKAVWDIFSLKLTRIRYQKNIVSSFQPHINSMLNDRIRGHLFPYHLLLQTETYIKASITYRTHVTQATENNNKIERKLRQND